MTAEELRGYFVGTKKHPGYKDTVDLYDEIRVHANGEMPVNLIHERRPSETDEIFAYRKKIYEPVTKSTMSRVIRVLSKIKRSSDWTINYLTKMPGQVADGETLEDYCEKDFPYTNSVTNWAFSVLLKNVLIDPNAVIMVCPLNQEAEENEYLEPFPIIYNSDQVYEFIEDKLAILLSTEQTEQKGKIFYVVDEVEIQRWEQKGNSTDFILTNTYVHGLEEMPVFKIGGVFKKAYNSDVVYESHIAGMIPYLNEAVREYSDMQAEVVQHIFSERWEWVNQYCNECYDSLAGVSTGKIQSGNGKRTITCTKCNGTGLMGTGPYKKMQIRPGKESLGESPAPIPPAGFIEKNVEIAKLQAERVDSHQYKALSAINMQFLDQTPLNQSGKAKEVDKEELNNFVYTIAEDIVKTMNTLYYFIGEYRYKLIVASDDERSEYLPIIHIPEKFDLTSSTMLVDELSKLNDSKASPTILRAVEADFCAKRFDTTPEVKQFMQCIFKLNPLPTMDLTDAQMALNANGITKQDFITYCNIDQFVRRAFFEDENFGALDLDKQKEIIAGYATELMDSLAADEAEDMKKLAAKAALNPVNPNDSAV